MLNLNVNLNNLSSFFHAPNKSTKQTNKSSQKNYRKGGNGQQPNKQFVIKVDANEFFNFYCFDDDDVWLQKQPNHEANIFVCLFQIRSKTIERQPLN